MTGKGNHTTDQNGDCGTLNTRVVKPQVRVRKHLDNCTNPSSMLCHLDVTENSLNVARYDQYVLIITVESYDDNQLCLTMLIT